MNRTLKDATVKRYYYQTHQQLKEHLHAFLMAYNFAKRLKTLRGLTPYQFICQAWQKPPILYQPLPSHRGTKQVARQATLRVRLMDFDGKVLLEDSQQVNVD